MSLRRRLVQALPVFGLSFVITGCASSTQPANQSDGRALYTTYCLSCHGADGRNDRSGATPAMRLRAANTLASPEWNHLVLVGRGQMPAFQNRLSPPQLDALRAYIQTLTAQR